MYLLYFQTHIFSIIFNGILNLNIFLGSSFRLFMAIHYKPQLTVLIKCMTLQIKRTSLTRLPDAIKKIINTCINEGEMPDNINIFSSKKLYWPRKKDNKKEKYIKNKKNPAYRKQSISRPMRIVSPPPRNF